MRRESLREMVEGKKVKVGTHIVFFPPLEPNTRKVQEKQLEKSFSFIFDGVETTRPSSIMYKFLCFFFFFLLERQKMHLKPRQKCSYPIKV